MEPHGPNQTNTPSQQPITPQVPAPNVSPTAPRQLTPRAEKLKKLSLQVMIGGLIGAAVVAVAAVLAGSFNSTFEKALSTLFVVVIHAMACLAFVEQTGKSKNSSFRFFENAVFSIIVLSFFTAIFGIWGLLSGDIVGKIYGTYAVLLFACLHGQMLVDTRGKRASIDTLVNFNYGVMAVVIILILPLIWLTPMDFPGFYFRLLAAFGIIDGTLTILAVIFHRLYLQKHPEARSPIFTVTTQLDSNGHPVVAQTVAQKRSVHPLLWLLGILLAGQLAASLLFALLGAFYR